MIIEQRNNGKSKNYTTKPDQPPTFDHSLLTVYQVFNQIIMIIW